MENLLLLTPQEQQLRLKKLWDAMAKAGIRSAIISYHANLYYLTGRVFSGYAYLYSPDAEPVYFVKRPTHLEGNVISIRKPESIIDEIKTHNLPMPQDVGIEYHTLSYGDALRLIKALGVSEAKNVSPCITEARACKTEFEIAKLRKSGVKHEAVYKRIPQLYKSGMTDIELQTEIEAVERFEGCLGIFRISGNDMEIHMGNLIAGDNADTPSPYDFAMGGAGLDPSLPVGANGTLIRRGMSVMVDLCGNFTGYMTDMSRSFACGEVSELAQKAHQLSIDICHAAAQLGRAGVEAKALYAMAEAMVKEAGLENYFMGHRQHAGFIGHGVGIEINELPVIAPRSKDVLAVGNAIALEPKFVIPGVGAVGIESTYIVTETGMECITNAAEQLIRLE